MKLLENPFMTVQYRFPKSRKKRIRAKWAKVPANLKPSTKVFVLYNDTVVCHPEVAARLRKELDFSEDIPVTFPGRLPQLSLEHLYPKADRWTVSPRGMWGVVVKKKDLGITIPCA